MDYVIHLFNNQDLLSKVEKGKQLTSTHPYSAVSTQVVPVSFFC